MARKKHPDAGLPPPDTYEKPPQAEWVGPWQVRVRWRKKGMPSVSKVCETWEEAWTWYEVKLAEFKHRGTIADRKEAERTTLAEAFDLYLASGLIEKKRGGEQERTRIGALKREPFAQLFLTSITVVDLQRWADARGEEGIAPSTVNNDLSAVSNCFKYLVTLPGYDGLGNPTRSVRRPRASEGRRVRFTREHEAALLAAIGDRKKVITTGWLGPLVRLALATGMRRGEIASLRWEGIHLDEAWLTVLESKNTAGGTRRRNVPLIPEAVAVFRELHQLAGPNPIGRVFPKADAKTTAKAFRAVANAAGLPDTTFHDLRHVAVTRLAQVVDNPLELSEFSGHRDMKTLKRYYNPEARDLAAKAARRLAS